MKILIIILAISMSENGKGSDGERVSAVNQAFS